MGRGRHPPRRHRRSAASAAATASRRVGVQLKQRLAGGHLVAEVDEQADAGGGLDGVFLAGAAGAEPPGGDADRQRVAALQHARTGRRAAPRRGDATGSGADGSPPCAAIIASHTG